MLPKSDEALIADIDTLLPRKHPEGVKWRCLAFPSRPDAPVLMVTRDDSVEGAIVPCLCVASEQPDKLMSVGQFAHEKTGGMMMVIHKLLGEMSGGMLFIPFLFDRQHKSNDFIREAEMIMALLKQQEIQFSSRIIFCHVTITRGGGRQVRPQDMRGAFNHDLRGRAKGGTY